MSLVAERVQVDWKRAGEDPDAFGCAVIRDVFTSERCDSLSAMYDKESRFRQPSGDGAAWIRAG